MRILLPIVAFAFAGLQALGPAPQLCVGAMAAQVSAAGQPVAQQEPDAPDDPNGPHPERHTPTGEWCQRPTSTMSRKAHACACHQHDCTDPDPSHVSAHKDYHCLNYCTQSQCRCATMDCP